MIKWLKYREKILKANLFLDVWVFHQSKRQDKEKATVEENKESRPGTAAVLHHRFSHMLFSKL